MIHRRLAAALCLTLALPLSGQTMGSDGDDGGGTHARLAARVPAVAIAPIDSILGAARAEGLPVEPLIQKALEGSAKRQPPARIVEAVGAAADQLRGARTLLRQAGERTSRPAEVVAVAAALARGVSPALVGRLSAALPGEPTGPALHAVADIVGHGFDEDSAVDLIVTAAGLGLRGLRFLDVAAAVVQEYQRQHDRTEALARVRRALPNVPLPPRPAPGTVVNARRLPAPAHPSTP